MAGGPDAFQAVVDLLDYPMFVVTTAAAGRRAGCLVGFAGQVSIDPPRFLVGLSDKNHTYALAQDAGRLAVHVLASTDRSVAELFGSRCGADTDKFAQCRWHAGADGVPVLDDAAGWFTGRIVERLRLGDHVGFLLEPDDGDAHDAERVLGFRDVRDLEPGHDA